MISKEPVFRMPAEWSTHAATLLQWPGNRETWPGERLDRVEKVYLDIIDALHRYEPVLLLASSQTIHHAENLLIERGLDRGQISLHEYPVNDVWARDCGPVFVSDMRGNSDQYSVIDWDYNAWGEKYLPFDEDNRIPAWIANRFDLPQYKPGIVLEGGSIDVNGEGDLITTESVLLNPNRNPHLTRMDIEQRLEKYLGASNIIWLKNGLAGDDTDGHIDDLARFINPETILAAVTDDPDSVNYENLQINLEILSQSVNTLGKPFQILTLPLPETETGEATVDGSIHVPASYINFYIANNVLLVPLYDTRYDEEALELFRNYFPDRDVIGIPCGDLVWGQGSIHCITQQLYGVVL